MFPIPKRNVAAYQRIAAKAAKVWKEHGALEYRECIGDDIGACPTGGVAAQPRGFIEGDL